MSWIVEKLRGEFPGEYVKEAAAEIERLEAALRKVKARGLGGSCPICDWILDDDGRGHDPGCILNEVGGGE